MAENSRLQGCHKKHKALNHEEHEGHKGKEKLFFVLFVFFVVHFFSEPFATPSFAGVTMIHSQLPLPLSACRALAIAR